MARRWSIAPEWKGEVCAVLASGPSMSQQVADLVRDRCRVIAINTTYQLAPWADILYAADREWWAAYPDAKSFAGRKVSILPNTGSLLEFDELDYVESGGDGLLDPRPTHVRTGKNSAYQAMHIAMHLGVHTILMCGLDLRVVDGMEHWHGDHPKGARKTMPFSSWISLFNQAAPFIQAKGVRVINCTPHSALHCFKKQQLEDALESVLSDKRNAVLSA
jgi:hypothetical protein